MYFMFKCSTSEIINKFHIPHVKELLHDKYQIILRMFPNHSVKKFTAIKTH